MSQKIKQTHGVKKDYTPAETQITPQSELLSAIVETDILFGPAGITTARPDFFEKITTIKEPALRHMASEGFFPQPIKRKFHITDTIRGVIKCLIARADRKSARELPTMPTMDAVEGAGIFTKKFLQTLKSAGVPGFNQNNSINFSALLPGLEAWLSGNNQTDKLELQREGVANWGSYREKYQGKSEKLKFDELDGRLMDADTAHQCGLAAQTVYFTMLDRVAVDFPGRLAGRNAAEIKTEVDKTLKKIRESVQKEFENRRKKSDQQLELQRKQDELVKI